MLSLEFSWFFNDPTDVGNLISGSSAFCKSILNIWKFLVHVLLKSDLENFEQYFVTIGDEFNCVVVWTLFGIAFLWDWSENWQKILHNSPLKSIVVQDNSWLLGAGIKWTDKKSYWLEVGQEVGYRTSFSISFTFSHVFLVSNVSLL